MNEQKSQLAKLLAQEGLEVVHDPSMQTAAFDPKKRILYLPVLKEMTGDVYDLFVLHEVGHALYTPRDGFHSAPEDKGKRYKGFINVVEDARIEKKIKRKYPGGRANMIRGYHNLMERDFFGVRKNNVNVLSMVDRFNLYFKCGLAMDIKFSEEEMEFIDRGRDLESWDDVLDLVEDLWAYAEDEEASTDLQEMLYYDLDEEDDEDREQKKIDLPPGYGEENQETDEEEKAKSESKSEGEGKENDEVNDEDEDEENEDDDYDEGGSYINDDHNVTQESLTDRAFRQNERDLVSLEESGAFHYVNLPDLDPELFVADYKTVIEDCIIPSEEIVNFRKTQGSSSYWHYPGQYESLEHFNQVNKPIISYMVKEFEMRKSASMAKRAKISQTGILNTSALHKYKIDDKIFKSILHTPEGKNHGLIFYIDLSGSMMNILTDVIAQSVLMAMFCRQVKIPYRIYGFTNGSQNKLGKMILKNRDPDASEPSLYGMMRSTDLLNFKAGDLTFDPSLCLYELFTDRQSSSDFQRICRALIEHPNYGSHPVPMGGTPLNEAIINGIGLCKNFRKIYNLDIVNTIFMSDGDSHSNVRYYAEQESKTEDDSVFGEFGHFNLGNDTVYIRDPKTHEQVVIKRGTRMRHYGWAMTKSLMDLYRKSTGSNTIYMNIVNRVEPNAGEKANKNWFDLKHDIRKNGWVKTDDEEIDSIYTILNKAFRIKDDAEKKFEGLEAGDKLNTVRSAFRNMNKNRLKQRFLVGNFIQEIA